MNKEELISAMAAKVKSTKAECERHLKAYLDVVQKALCDGDDLQLIGFGRFSVAETAARKGRNPQTGKPITIAAGKRVKFSAGKQLKEAVNKSKGSKKKK